MHDKQYLGHLTFKLGHTQPQSFKVQPLQARPVGKLLIFSPKFQANIGESVLADIKLKLTSLPLVSYSLLRSSMSYLRSYDHYSGQPFGPESGQPC